MPNYACSCTAASQPSVYRVGRFFSSIYRGPKTIEIAENAQTSGMPLVSVGAAIILNWHRASGHKSEDPQCQNHHRYGTWQEKTEPDVRGMNVSTEGGVAFTYCYHRHLVSQGVRGSMVSGLDLCGQLCGDWKLMMARALWSSASEHTILNMSCATNGSDSTT
ncbi:hypothetical protein FIBSPDRAFT_14978 [Athelia psychrophila]|uniref:Uncharacterized protein n=1 Tax=Athelia psychrophila TaxID=1759441 RepID=A0A166XF78_9AGAM|nr:hypothetical protein FIBSPDRAFT_14978 [Fibularhizoctonia sp. CBS 109695]